MYVQLNNHIEGKWRCIFTLFPIDTSTLDLVVSLESCHDRPPSMPQLTPSFFIKSRTAVSQSTCLLMQDTQNSLQTLWVSMLWPMCLFWTNCCNGHQTKERAFKNVCFFILHAFLQVWKLSCRLESTIPWQRWTQRRIHNIKMGMKFWWHDHWI